MYLPPCTTCTGPRTAVKCCGDPGLLTAGKIPFWPGDLGCLGCLGEGVCQLNAKNLQPKIAQKWLSRGGALTSERKCISHVVSSLLSDTLTETTRVRERCRHLLHIYGYVATLTEAKIELSIYILLKDQTGGPFNIHRIGGKRGSFFNLQHLQHLLGRHLFSRSPFCSLGCPRNPPKAASQYERGGFSSSSSGSQHIIVEVFAHLKEENGPKSQPRPPSYATRRLALSPDDRRWCNVKVLLPLADR